MNLATTKQIDGVIDAFIGNPYLDDGLLKRREQAPLIDGMLEDGALPAIYRGLTEAKDSERLEKLILSIGHYQTCFKGAQGEEWAAEADALPSAEGRNQLQYKVREYICCVNAAARSYHALEKVVGASDSIIKVKRETWYASFGKSLYHVLRRRKLIREHNVLVVGETGTGKELFCQAILEADMGGPEGAQGERVSINAAAVPSELFESELFGHVKGAFTGAVRDRLGAIGKAHKGSLFLDEIGDIPLSAQAKLLRVIESQSLRRVGDEEEKPAEVRYISASNHDLSDTTKFRSELYQRIAGSEIRIPPLRERMSDIEAMGREYVRRRIKEHKTEVLDQREYKQFLKNLAVYNYDWPGNVRELQKVLRSFLLGLITEVPQIVESAPAHIDTENKAPHPTLRDMVNGHATEEEVLDWYYEHVFSHTKSNYTKAGNILGVNRSTVQRRLKKIRNRT